MVLGKATKKKKKENQPFDPGVPLEEVRGRDTLCLLDGIAAVSILNQVVLVAVRDDARLLWLRPFGRRCRRLGSRLGCAGAGASGGCSGHGDAIVISQIELAAVIFHGGIPRNEGSDAESAEAIRDSLAGVAGDGLVVLCTWNTLVNRCSEPDSLLHQGRLT